MGLAGKIGTSIRLTYNQKTLESCCHHLKPFIYPGNFQYPPIMQKCKISDTQFSRAGIKASSYRLHVTSPENPQFLDLGSPLQEDTVCKNLLLEHAFQEK